MILMRVLLRFRVDLFTFIGANVIPLDRCRTRVNAPKSAGVSVTSVRISIDAASNFARPAAFGSIRHSCAPVFPSISRARAAHALRNRYALAEMRALEFKPLHKDAVDVGIFAYRRNQDEKE